MPAITDGFQEAIEGPDELHEAIVPVPRPSFLPPPLEDDPPQSGIMGRVNELADQAAGFIGSNLSAAVVEKGSELALAAGAAPGLVAAGAVAAGSALAPVAKDVVKGAGRLAYNVADATVGNTLRFYRDEGKYIIDQARDYFRERTPLETLISIPVLTAQDVIRNLLSHPPDPVTSGDNDLMPIGRNARDPPPWLPSMPEVVPRNYQPALPTSAPQSYGPSNPYSQASSSSSSSSAEPSRASVGYTVYNDVGEWLANVKSKGALVEEIYKRPGWARAMGVENSRGFSSDDQAAILRQKLRKMDRKELARILIYLDEQAGHRRDD